MASFHIYLNFAGTTERAFAFYQSVFGGELRDLQRFGDVPGMPIPADFHNHIMHISLPLSDHVVLMGTDALAELGHPLTQGNNVHISVSPDSEADARRIFAALAEGGEVKATLETQFWGALYGALVDRFGVQWMINYVPASMENTATTRLAPNEQ